MEGPTLSVALPNGKVLNADILQYSAPITENGKDVAVLKVPGSNYPTVPLGNSDQVRLQDTVMVMGYPGVASSFGNNPIISAESNFEASATNGHISAIKTGTIGVPLLQSDVAITHGNSGGPPSMRGVKLSASLRQERSSRDSTSSYPSTRQWNSYGKPALHPRAAPSTSTGMPALIFTTPGNIARPSGNSTMPCSSCLTSGRQEISSLGRACGRSPQPMQRMMETTGKLPIYAVVGILLLGALALDIAS